MKAGMEILESAFHKERKRKGRDEQFYP